MSAPAVTASSSSSLSTDRTEFYQIVLDKAPSDDELRALIEDVKEKKLKVVSIPYTFFGEDTLWTELVENIDFSELEVFRMPVRVMKQLANKLRQAGRLQVFEPRCINRTEEEALLIIDAMPRTLTQLHLEWTIFTPKVADAVFKKFDLSRMTGIHISVRNSDETKSNLNKLPLAQLTELSFESLLTPLPTENLRGSHCLQRLNLNIKGPATNEWVLSTINPAPLRHLNINSNQTFRLKYFIGYLLTTPPWRNIESATVNDVTIDELKRLVPTLSEAHDLFGLEEGRAAYIRPLLEQLGRIPRIEILGHFTALWDVIDTTNPFTDPGAHLNGVDLIRHLDHLCEQRIGNDPPKRVSYTEKLQSLDSSTRRKAKEAAEQARVPQRAPIPTYTHTRTELIFPKNVRFPPSSDPFWDQVLERLDPSELETVDGAYFLSCKSSTERIALLCRKLREAKNLRFLYLRYHPSDPVLEGKELVKALPDSLEHLYLDWITIDGDLAEVLTFKYGYRQMAGCSLSFTGTYSQKIEQLLASNIFITMTYVNLFYVQERYLSELRLSPDLEHLLIRHSGRNPNTVLSLVQSCPQLKSVEFGPYNFADYVFLRFSLPRIEKVILHTPLNTYALNPKSLISMAEAAIVVERKLPNNFVGNFSRTQVIAFHTRLYQRINAPMPFPPPNISGGALFEALQYKPPNEEMRHIYYGELEALHRESIPT